MYNPICETGDEMKVIYIAIFVALVSACVATAQKTNNLIQNGSFDDPGDPFRGWTIDYKALGNEFTHNSKRISFLPFEDGRTSVMRVDNVMEGGTKAESSIIPFDISQKYRATLYVKGGPYRIYFAGYQWKPGVRPYDNPRPEDLRMVYRSKTATGRAKSWTLLSLDIPGVAASELSLKHMKKIRFLRLYILFHTIEHVGDTGFVDDVSIVKLN